MLFGINGERSEFSSLVFILARRCNQLMLFTARLCSGVVKSGLFSSLSTCPLSVGQRLKLGATDEV